MEHKYHVPRTGDPVTLTTDATMRPSRLDPEDRPHGRLVGAWRGELLVVLSVTGPMGSHGPTVEVLTPRGETAWIWASYLSPAR